jgi:hypothetical protein
MAEMKKQIDELVTQQKAKNDELNTERSKILQERAEYLNLIEQAKQHKQSLED